MVISSRHQHQQQQQQQQQQNEQQSRRLMQKQQDGEKEVELKIDSNNTDDAIVIDVHSSNNGGNNISTASLGPFHRLAAIASSMEAVGMNMYKNHCTYFFPMAGWFLFSALLSSYNKYVFGNGHMSFPCPLLLTSIHFLGQWGFSYVISEAYPAYFGLDRIQPPQMSRKEFLMTSIPCGIVASLDIGFSNLSMVTISLTFYTMVKSSTPVFVLIWAYLFGIGKITWHLILVVLIIAAGEFLTVTGEVEFDPRGFTFCLLAAILSGARWTLVQLKIQSMDPPIKTTIVTMRLLSPSMCLSMFLLSLMIEQPWSTLLEAVESLKQFLTLFALGGLGAVFAICMILCEFYLIMHTSAIVLMIGGVLKEMMTIVIGVSFFHDHLNRINVTGCFIVFLGVIYYKLTYSVDNERVPKSKTDEAETLSDSITDVEKNNKGTYELVDTMGDASTVATTEDDITTTSPLYFSDSTDTTNNILDGDQHILHNNNNNNTTTSDPKSAAPLLKRKSSNDNNNNNINESAELGPAP